MAKKGSVRKREGGTRTPTVLPTLDGEPAMLHAEAAEYLGYTTGTLYHKVRRGHIPGRRWRNVRIYYRSELKDLRPGRDLGHVGAGSHTGETGAQAEA